ncbi:MAG: hypothetical protein AAGA66_08405 [Bacteroidota bacterium]
MIKELFKLARTKLGEVTELNWVDLDKRQMEDYEMRPSIGFPAALISVQFPGCENEEELKGLKQRVEGLLTVRICHDFTGNTSGITNEMELERSLQFLDVVQSVYEKLQGFTDGSFNKLERISLRDEQRGDKYKIVNMVFKTATRDHTAVV